MNVMPGSRRKAALAWVDQQLGPLIAALELEPAQRTFMRERWLDQVRWAEGKTATSQWWYRRLRLVAIAGGVTIPALVGLNVAGTASQDIRWAAFGLGLLVALATAIEGFFHYSDRWPHYRRFAEQLKSEGWQFFQLTGIYAGAASHQACYQQFAGRVEAIIQSDVQVFFTQVAIDKPKPKDGETPQLGEAGQGDNGGAAPDTGHPVAVTHAQDRG
jgi:hypothetical protein